MANAVGNNQAVRDNSARLYTPRVLALTIELANYPHDPAAKLQGAAKSRTCGSEIILSGTGVESDGQSEDESALGTIGMTVTACAIGQASAAIFADCATGQSAQAIRAIAQNMEEWIKGDRTSEFLPRLDLLEPARAFPARHDAILLPWRAALDALSTGDTSG